MTDIFISYARSQNTLAEDLRVALNKHGISCWVDRFNIGPAEKWDSAIREGILSADNFLILLDIDWIKSYICRQEYRYAVDFGKTLIPVIAEPVSPPEWKGKKYPVPDELASRNYIWSYEQNFSHIVHEIAAAARTDYEWKKLLSILEHRAQRWQSSGKTFGLLRGQELLGVQASVSRSAGKKPLITGTVADFIQSSQQEEMRELEEQRERARQAESRSLAAKAEKLCLEEPLESLGFLNTAWHLSPTIEALQAIGYWYETHLHLAGAWKRKFAISGVAVDEANHKMVSCEFISSIVSGNKPQQNLIVQDLRDLGKLDSLSDIDGFGGCAWANSQLVTLRKANVISYRYDLFKERYRHSTPGQVLPIHESKMIINPSHSFIALPGDFKGLFRYDISQDRMARFATNGSCVDAAWIDDMTLLVVEGGGLYKRHIGAFKDPIELIPPDHDIVAIDTDGENWLALSCSDRVYLYRSHPNGINAVCVHHAPDPSVGIRIGTRGTAFIYGGGGSASSNGILEVDIDSGQPIRVWLGGFKKRVNHLDLGRGKWMAAGRKDGLVLLWNREKISIETEACEPALAAPIEARINDRGQLTVKENGLQIFSSQIDLPNDFPIFFNSPPCAKNDNDLCIGCGNTLIWYNLDDPAKAIVNKGTVHTNDIGYLACSHSNSLWVSSATNYRDNALMEIFAWRQKSQWPVLKLILPRLEHNQIAFDKSGKILLFLKDDFVIKGIFMDPESWLEHGESMSRMEWTSMT